MPDQRLLATGDVSMTTATEPMTSPISKRAQNARRVQIASEGLAVARFLPGVIASKIGFMIVQSRTAAIGANIESCVVLIGRAALDYLAPHEPKLASALHGGLSRQLAKNLSRTTALAHALV